MPRYAIFFAPLAGDPLNDIAAKWLGRDVFSGISLDRPSPVEGVDTLAFNALTRSARRHGFHGTLKAPFELADGRSIEELEVALEDFCMHQAPFTLPQLKIGKLGGFFALVPRESSQTLSELAAKIVTEFDEFRAPLGEFDVARRHPESLSDSQRDNLLNWGDPFIFEDFRFHMTLTDAINSQQSEQIEQALNEMFAPCLKTPSEVSALSIYVEQSPGAPFILYRQIAFEKSDPNLVKQPSKKGWLSSLFRRR